MERLRTDPPPAGRKIILYLSTTSYKIYVERQMPKKIAPTKVTGGGGNTFENKVATFFVAKMIAGLPPLAPEDGILTRVDFQTRVDGWFLDDILLTLDRNGETHRRSISIKSDAQFTMKSAPADFVGACWEQYLHEGSTVFDRDADGLGIIVDTLGQAVSLALSNLQSKARKQDSSDLARRIDEPNYMSQVERDLFASFGCPPPLATSRGITAAETGKLLAKVLVSEFDLDRADSGRLREADQACLGSLVDPSQSPALWEALLALVADHRAAGGYLDRTKVLGLLRTRFQFRAFPFHEPDWKKLAAHTSDALETVGDAIGGSVKLPRDDMRTLIETGFMSSTVVCLLGGSGLGKTALAKAFLQRAPSATVSLWIDAQQLESADIAAFEAKLRLTYSLGDLLAGIAQGIVVIDGVERVYSESGFKNVALLLKKLMPFGQPSGWKILLTCQPEEWDRVQRGLFRAKADPRTWSTPMLELPKLKELTPLWQAFPQLQPISLRRDLHPVLLRPKVLDLLANRIALGNIPDFNSWIGESDFIKWFWESEVNKGADAAPRARFVQLLAERQAALVSHEVPRDEFQVGDLAPLRGLAEDRICADRDERIAFGHDLYGDWARQSILVGRQPDLGGLAEKALSPLWHKAIRLYGLHLLESPGKAAEWVQLIRQEPAGNSESQWKLAQDLLLEAVIFAADPLSALDRALPELIAGDGALLRRLLDRFLHVATLPDPRILAYARAEGVDEAGAAAFNRLPYWPFWLPMLKFLTKSADRVLDRAPWALAKICETWLRRGGADWPLRDEVAAMALQLAEKYGAEDDFRSARLHGEAEETMFRAALAGAPERPEAVAALARRLSRRTVDPVAMAARPPHAPGAKVRRVVSSFHGSYEEVVPPPWPDGPSDRVDPAFKRVCLSSDALLPLIETSPAVAKEVVLALLIEAREARGPFDHRSDIHFAYGLNEEHDWFPPIFLRGPFLLMLQRRPVEGLDCILRLVNFAVDRWAEHVEAKAPNLEVPLSTGLKRYFGTYQMFYWYRGEIGPRAVEIALMALEKHLYDRLDAGEDVEPIIATILERSNSVAPLGVLAALGNKKPELYLKALKPLLAVPEFHEWERGRVMTGNGMWQIAWGMQGSFETKIAADWHQLPHRKISLHDVALHWFHNDEGVRKLLNEARAEWEKRAAAFDGDGGDKLLNLASFFDPANWHPDNSDPTQPKLAFSRPKELQERNAPHLKTVLAAQKLLVFPMECRRIIDGEATVRPDALESFWEQIREIEAMEVPKGDDAERKENAVCGGIAALAIKHRDWLFGDPERGRWCGDYLRRVIQSPPPPTDFDSDVALASWHWDRFCAQAVPVFWAREVKSKEWRLCAALLATSRHFETVSYLFLSALSVRGELGSDFSAMQHLLVRWAAAHAAWYEESRNRDAADLIRRRRAEVEAFVAGKVSAKIPDWRDVAAGRKTRKGTSRRGRRSREVPGFEIQVLQAAFSVFPGLSEARDEAERAEWVALWRNALNVSLDMLGDGDGEVDGTPYEFDRWVLGRAAELIPELRDAERPDLFWKPILDLGLGAHYWIDDFFYRWFRVGARFERLDSPFFVQWKAMIAHARQSPKWGTRPSQSRSHRQELWWQLLGLSVAAHSFWSAERREMANALKESLHEWAEAHLQSGSAALIFAAFLRREAAVDLVPDGLQWLGNGLKAAASRYWDERDIGPELASMLGHAWDKCGARVRASLPSMQAFNLILTALVSRNVPSALQLRDTIARTKQQ